MKRRLQRIARKTLFLRVRVSEAHDAEIKGAAARAGITVSAWAIERLLKFARQEAKAAAAAGT